MPPDICIHPYSLACAIDIKWSFSRRQLSIAATPRKGRLKNASGAELTQIKCYRGWEVDEGSADTLTHNHGYRSPEHEFDLQTRVSRQDPRSLSTRRSSAQESHSRRVLPQLRLSSQSRLAAAASSSGRAGSQTIRPQNHL